MKKHITLTFIIFIAMFLSMMGNVYAADANGDGYNDNDVSIINNIITNNGLDWEKDKPVNWSDAVITWQVDDENGEKRISSLNFSNYDLYGELDLSGLTNLETLICFNTKITGLDVSNLTNLTYLACSDTEITELDVSNLPRLEVLYCENTKITKLDVSNLTNLTDLYCYNTEITELDVSKSTNLTCLGCSDTEITELDVSNLPGLEFLYCDNTKITKLDVSNLTNLIDLYCYNTKITELDVSKLTNLKYLDCSNTEITELDVSKSTNLTYLGCSDTEITELDVSNLPRLEVLYCENTKITKLDVSKLTNLTDLYCYNTEITELDVSNLTNLTYLECSLANLTTVMGHLVSVDTDCSNNVFITDYFVSENKVSIIAEPKEKFVFDSWLGYPSGSLVDNDRLTVYPEGDIVVSALYVVPTVSFLGSSENQSFSKGVDNSLEFVLDQPNMFGKVYVDDHELRAGEETYSWRILESYPCITLSYIYLDTLNVGTHTIKFVLDNGLQAETTFTIVEQEDNDNKDDNTENKPSDDNKDDNTENKPSNDNQDNNTENKPSNDNKDDNTENKPNNDNKNDNKGNANTSGNNSKNPQTGDNIMLFVAILGTAIIGIVVTTRLRKD